MGNTNAVQVLDGRHDLYPVASGCMFTIRAVNLKLLRKD
jgi:hypothetical protein